MPPNTTAAFRLFLKSNPNMRLMSDAAVVRVTYEGVTSYESLADFDKDSLKELARNCRTTIPAVVEDADAGIGAEPEVQGTVISTQSLVRLQVACKAVKYYISVGRTPDGDSLHYANVLQHFKLADEAYEQLKDQDSPEIPDVKDSDKEKKVIKWAPVFMDCMSRTFGVKGPLAYVLRATVEVKPEAEDPLVANAYYGSSGSLQQELIDRLAHGDALYRSDNKTVYMHIEKACRGTSVASTVKTFSRTQDGRGAYLALIDHHAGDSKYRSILKSKMNLLQNVKWNGRNYSLEKHVSNHRQAVEDLQDCGQHIQVAVPDAGQRVEYLLDSITCNDSTLQASIGLVRSNVNNMRTNFELAANALIEVDPYIRSRRTTPKPTANVSSIDFSSGRGDTGVDLRWHTPKEFKALTKEQKDELTSWQKTDDGKAVLAKSKEDALAKKRKENDSGEKGETHKKRKKWLKGFIKKPAGVKHVMELMATVEAKNATMLSSLTATSQSTSTPPVASSGTVGSASATPAVHASPSNAPSVSSVNARYPATTVKLQSILKKT